MKRKIIAVTLILSAIFLLSFEQLINGLPIGSALPNGDVKLKDVTGKMVTMQEAKKKNGLLVMFSCNTCPYVIRNQQRTKAVCKYALQNNIGVILLNSNETQRDEGDGFTDMQAYAKEQGYQWNYVVDVDSKIADAFGANRTPECFLFNSDLKLSYHGGIDDNPGDEENVSRQYLKEAINQLISGKDIAVKETRSVGCSIKRKG